jgi:hypothetical protein
MWGGGYKEKIKVITTASGGKHAVVTREVLEFD